MEGLLPFDDALGRARSVVASLVAGVDNRGSGWATQTLRVSVRRVVLGMMASLQLISAAVALFSVGATPAGPALVLGYLCVFGYSVVAVRHDVPVVPLLMGMYVMGVAGYLVSEDLGSALTFAACWLINAAGCGVAMLVPGRSGFALVLVPGVLIAAVILTFLPHWGWHFPVATFVTQASILVAVRLGLPALFRFAQRSDDESAVAEQAIHAAGVLRIASQKIAEDARVLHDTAINTLGAIANGGGVIADVHQVREQCGRDVAQLEALQTASDEAKNVRVSLFELFGLTGLPIRRTGLDDDEVYRLSDRLPHEVIRAVVGCAREAARNAAKHSAADHIDVHLARDGDVLEVTVRDAGRGFDGRFSPGRGIAESVFARAEAAGVDVDLTTSPGEGTTFTIRAALVAGQVSARDAPRVVGDVGGTVTGIYQRAGSLWGAGVTVVSVVLTGIGGANHALALFPMIGLMGFCWAVTALAHRARPGETALPVYVLGLLIVGAPAVFTLSAAAVGFGSDGAVDWQALAATGPFVLFLAARPRRALFWAGTTTWIMVVVILAVATWSRDPNDAVIVLVAGCVGVGFSLGWNQFQNTISRIGDQAARSQQQAFEARLATDLQAAAQTTFRRWLDAGLEHSIQLLRRIANGRLSPTSTETQALCDSEELYLRQLTLVSPELIHLGHAVMPVLAAARARGVQMTVQLGERDTADGSIARTISELMLDAVAAVPRHGSLTATVFPVREGLQFTLIASYPALEPLSRRAAEGLRYERLSGIELLQMNIARSTAQTGSAPSHPATTANT
jgi:hypothetical protein